MCCTYASLLSLMHFFFSTLACFVCRLRFLFSAEKRMHVALLPLEMLQPSHTEEEKAILWLQSRSESVRDWRRGIAQEGREGLEDRVARQTRITWAQICLQTECVRPGKTQEPSWRILLACLTSTHLEPPDACLLAGIFVQWAEGRLVSCLLFWRKDWESRWF